MKNSSITLRLSESCCCSLLGATRQQRLTGEHTLPSDGKTPSLAIVRHSPLTLLVVQQEVAVLVATGDGVGDAVSVRVVGVDDGHQRVWTGVLAEEGLVTGRGRERLVLNAEYMGGGEGWRKEEGRGFNPKKMKRGGRK